MFSFFDKEKNKYNYFFYFEEIATLVYESTEIVLRNLKNYELSSLEEEGKKIYEIESIADKKKKQMMNYLYKDFLPPIEREDIINLAHVLDIVLNNIKELLIQVDMYQIKYIYPHMILLIELIEKISLKTLNIVKELKNFKKPEKLMDMNKEIIKLENQGDIIYYQGVKKLHMEKKDSLENYKYSKIYDLFEKSINSFEDIANVIEAIILKNT